MRDLINFILICSYLYLSKPLQVLSLTRRHTPSAPDNTHSRDLLIGRLNRVEFCEAR